jgi:D-alanyl-D-alanine carboxypeptidase
VAGEGELLLGRLRREVHRRARVAPLDEVEIVGAGSRTEAGAGARLCGKPARTPRERRQYDRRMTEARLVEAVDVAALAAIERGAQPGLALAVTDPDRTLVLRTYGHAQLESRIPVVPETLFEIGSIGKTFTAVAVLRLADEGALNLDAPVAEYLPWFAVPQPAGAPPITVAHLLSHTAGIVAGIDATPEAAFQVWSLHDLPAASAPGERFHYSNVGYKALGLVLEAVDGRPYPEVVRGRVLDPLGMSATEPAITHDVRERLAVGYEYLHDDRIGHAGSPLVPATWLETATADGSIASTAADMAEFARFLLREGEGLLSRAAWERMSTVHGRAGPTEAYGYGLLIRELDGRRYIGHGGGMVGYAAGLQVDADAGMGAVVLQNGYGVHAMALARSLIGIARGAPAGAQVAAQGRALDAADLAGAFDLVAPSDLPSGARGGEGARRIELANSDDGLVLRFDRGEVSLLDWGDDGFLAPHAPFDRFALRAHRTDDGGLELWHGADRYMRAGSAPRPLPEPPRELRAIAGHYRSHNPWTTNFRVVVRGHRAWLVFASEPDGFDDEQPLAAAPDGSFRVADDPGNPEHVRFDTEVGGRALRAWLSGWPYYRIG